MLSILAFIIQCNCFGIFCNEVFGFIILLHQPTLLIFGGESSGREKASVI